MKKFIIGAVALTSLILVSCGGETAPEVEVINLDTFKKKISYALGADQAQSVLSVPDAVVDNYNDSAMCAGFANGFEAVNEVNAEENPFDGDCSKVLQSFFGPNGQAMDTSLYSFKEVSDCMGNITGKIFKASWIKNGAIDKIDKDMLVAGFRHGIAKTDTLISIEERTSMIQDFFMDIQVEQGTKMMDAAKALPNVTTTASGLVIETIEEGTGAQVMPGADVEAHYILMNSKGDTLQSSFDVSRLYGQPAPVFSLNGVVAGWQEGIPMMKVGGKYKLYVPYELGYGERGSFDQRSNSYTIQPYEALTFFVEVLKSGEPGSLQQPQMQR